MTIFTGFDEAARLYADNYAVVKEMEKAYRENVTCCLSALEDAVKRCLEPVSFRMYSTSAYRYWCSGEGGHRHRPYLWFAHNDPSFIDHRGISLLAVAPDCASVRQVEALRGLVLGADLDQGRRTGGFELFDFVVDFNGDNFVEVAAKQIAVILTAMAEAFDSMATG